MKAATHPSEHALALPPSAIGVLKKVADAEGSPPTMQRQADFILYPVPPRPAP